MAERRSAQSRRALSIGHHPPPRPFNRWLSARARSGAFHCIQKGGDRPGHPLCQPDRNCVKISTSALCLAILLLCSGALAQDARSFVQHAVSTELAADRNDHSRWLIRDSDRRPGNHVLQWIAQTSSGNVVRVMKKNGRSVPLDQQRHAVEAFVRSSSAQAKQRQDTKHDDQQAEMLLRMLPKVFRWTFAGKSADGTTLHFEPDPSFNPSTKEARVFAGMAGTMIVSNGDYRIRTFRGRLTRDITFGWWGVLGRLNAGGNFDVERRQTGGGVWQITETHVHIQGHALLFKSISEQEDDVRSDFRRLPDDIDLQQAAKLVMSQPES
jgi:hypothetical protein